MIALTQEKREELANYARARLASHVVHGGCSDEEEIFKMALASLTAEPVGNFCEFEKGDWWQLGPHDKVPRITPLYAAPPVPEIKLPPEFNESHDSFNEFRRGWNGAISEVKRTNGLGE